MKRIVVYYPCTWSEFLRISKVNQSARTTVIRPRKKKRTQPRASQVGIPPRPGGSRELRRNL